MTTAPKSIKALKDQGLFEIVWQDGTQSRLPFKFLRCECPCAACVNELTGEKMLDPASVPEDVQPQALGYSGNYALKIGWSDGHHTGLYSWDTLHRLVNRTDNS